MEASPTNNGIELTPIPSNPTSTDVFLSSPSWTIPTRTGPLYKGRPTAILESSSPAPTHPNVITPTKNGNGGNVIIPTSKLENILPGESIASSEVTGGTATVLVTEAITFQPGSATSFRGSSTSTPSLQSSTEAYTLVPSSMTSLLFAFAFIGALVVGIVMGIVIMKYTRFAQKDGCWYRETNKEKGDLAEQLRLLTNTLEHQNDRLDREEKQTYAMMDASSHSSEFLPSWYYHHPRHGFYSPFDRLQPQSIVDKRANQEWIGPNMAPTPLDSPTISNQSSPRNMHASPRQFSCLSSFPTHDATVNARKNDLSLTDVNSSSSGQDNTLLTSDNLTDLIEPEVEKRRPQIQEEGVGHESLFDIDYPCQNPQLPWGANSMANNALLVNRSNNELACSDGIRDNNNNNNSNNIINAHSNNHGQAESTGEPPRVQATRPYETKANNIRRPQRQEAGIGEESLFNVEYPCHNPHAA
ncbi:hypothetical protein FBU30_008323 [Linnemannia zychae]|nr:hypothetical protein FBU30_008323 [Linnemannia zychae]